MQLPAGCAADGFEAELAGAVGVEAGRELDGA